MYYQPNNTPNEPRSILATLRAVIPPRPLEFGEALQLAESDWPSWRPRCLPTCPAIPRRRSRRPSG
jgi:hypothetical protein